MVFSRGSHVSIGTLFRWTAARWEKMRSSTSEWSVCSMAEVMTPHLMGIVGGGVSVRCGTMLHLYIQLHRRELRALPAASYQISSYLQFALSSIRTSILVADTRCARMAATLSLEPLLHALPLKSESIDVAAPAPAQADQYSLAARLQRLWQERGDFSKLSVESLKVEDGEEAGAEASLDKDLTTTDVDQAVSTAENEDDNGNKEQAKAEEEQSMTQEQLWDLKLGILQGLESVAVPSSLRDVM